MTTPAASKNIVTIENARFTLLTNRLIRLEWAEDGIWEDRATLRVCNRKTDPVAFSVKDEGNQTVLQTEALTLNYTPNGKPLAKSNLSIEFQLNGKTVRWWPGKKDRQNLGGTACTLDGINGDQKKVWVSEEEKDPEKPVLLSNKGGSWIWQGDTEPVPLCDGLISKSGWAVVDDSDSVVLDPELCDWQPWVCERPEGSRQDLYFLGYGHAYTDALRDAQDLFGRQPLPPRYALGYWYSRYWAYTDKELMQLVEDFDRMDLPLDVLVIDMDWHKMGWTGYSWDPDYFPEPKALLDWLRKKGVKITLNLHPADGVFDFEDAFPDMLKEMGLSRKDLPDLEPVYHRLYELMGLDPDTAKRIPLDICDPNYMRAYFKSLHHPLERMGVDFWWMDWQQGSTGSSLPSLDTLPWINELHWQDQVARTPKQRPINFSRFGGVGAGRMPVGFSGDTYVNWESLAFQPSFTATASNVLYGTWSHDIGGHMQGELTPELYTRWMQFGILSPILRTHTSKSPDCERRVFHFPDPARSIMMDAMRRRYELVPYISKGLRQAWETGVSLLRPMYYQWPEQKEAYTFKDQYMFGDDMLVAPVIKPLDENQLASVRVWLPEGDWIDTATGILLEGGQVLKRYYTLAEIPVFVRPGTVIAEQAATRRLKKGSYRELIFRIHRGKNGAGSLYEDDGTSMDWQQGGSVSITCSHHKKGSVRTVKLHPAEGSFKGFRAKRKVSLILEGFAPPKEVSAGAWRYDGDTACIRVELGTVDLTKGMEVEIREAGAAVQAKANGLKGWMTRLESIRADVCLVSPCRPIHGEERLAVEAAQTGRRITLNPTAFSKEMDHLDSLLERLPASLKAYERAYHDPNADKPNEKELTLSNARRLMMAARRTL